ASKTSLSRYVRWDRPTIDQREGRVQAEVRRRRVTLGVEQFERVDGALREAEVRRLRVEIDRAIERTVQAAEVDRELAVDEDPEIVVAAELERLAAVV